VFYDTQSSSTRNDNRSNARTLLAQNRAAVDLSTLIELFKALMSRGESREPAPSDGDNFLCSDDLRKCQFCLDFRVLLAALA
jgi:hypothetical protein